MVMTRFRLYPLAFMLLDVTLLMIPWLVKEALEGLRGDACSDGAVVCWYGLRKCTDAVVLAPRPFDGERDGRGKTTGYSDWSRRTSGPRVNVGSTPRQGDERLQATLKGLGRGWILALCFSAGALIACGDGPEKGAMTAAAGAASSGKLTAIVASSDLAVGRQRLSFVVLDGDVPVKGKDAYVRFFKNADSGQPKLVGEGPIPWADLGAEEGDHGGPDHSETAITGIYFVNAAFDEPGVWGLGVSLGTSADPANEARVQFTVRAKNQTFALGAQAIAATNATLTDRPVAQIHTGDDPDPGFHDMTIAQALSSGKPSVVIFATPAFCRTRTCGPSLRVAIKAAAKVAGRVNFVHIEPYELDASGNLANGPEGKPFVLVPSAVAWRLPTEPWVFVVDKNGVVVARFDGPYALEELDHILSVVAAGG